STSSTRQPHFTAPAPSAPPSHTRRAAGSSPHACETAAPIHPSHPSADCPAKNPSHQQTTVAGLRQRTAYPFRESADRAVSPPQQPTPLLLTLSTAPSEPFDDSAGADSNRSTRAEYSQTKETPSHRMDRPLQSPARAVRNSAAQSRARSHSTSETGKPQ